MQRTFEPNAIPFSSPAGEAWDYCLARVRSASIVHIHNQLPVEAIRLLAAARGDAKIVFHIHSPPRERPNFFDHSPFFPVEPDLTLVVPHFHPRCFWDAVAVPNVVEGPGIARVRGESAVPTVMFSPSHRHQGGWNAKSGPETEAALNVLRSHQNLRVIVAEGMAPGELLARRCDATFSIDEVETGSYHQVSIEALACGSIAVNNADELAMASLRMAYQVDEPPPFLRTPAESLAEAILEVSSRRAEVERMRSSSLRFFEQHMAPEAVVKRYAELYEAL